MATMDDEEIQKQRCKMAEGLGRLTLWKLRDMRRLWPRPRAMRLPKQARALKSLLAEARSAGLVPATDLPKRRGRPARPRAELGAPPSALPPKGGLQDQHGAG